MSTHATECSNIMITCYGDAGTKRRALENDAEAHLTNPIDSVICESAEPHDPHGFRFDVARRCGAVHWQVEFSRIAALHGSGLGTALTISQMQQRPAEIEGR
jgi:hypothetical protein